MAIPEAQKKAIEEVVGVLTSTTAGNKGKRRLAEMFLELPDRDAWSEYYEIIPEPRCIDGVKFKLGRYDKKGYHNALEVYEDLSLVFLNALYYNEEGSQISKDATFLKAIMETEWKKRPALPTPPEAPPESSPQKSSQSKPVVSSSKTQPAASTVKMSNAVKPAKVPTTPAPPPATALATASTPVSIPTTTQTVAQSHSQEMDMDVDIGGGPSDNEGEAENYAYLGPVTNVTRDAESDDIVWQLERALPRWGGYGDKGWLEGVDLDRCVDIVHAIKSHKDVVSNSRVAAALDAIPEDIAIKNLSFSTPLSVKLIESKARSKEYATCKEFDLDMIRLFEKARRWYDAGGDQYGDVLLLQRLYQALTSPNPPPGPPYTSQTNFSSIRAGPGIAKVTHVQSFENFVDQGLSGVTTFRIPTKDRHFVDEVNYKGWSIRLADWVHLANPDDPNRPIVAQVYRCWISDEPSKAGRPGISVCWYFRPEQTFHPINREFWEGEIFKTGHFADHPLEDIIERIAVQFTSRHLRGRPRAPFWWPGWPLYVCDSRYNDREHTFVRIKNWASCVPEEVRKKPDWMNIYEFERPVAPRRLTSPFLPQSNVKGRRGGHLPGGVGDAVERTETDKAEVAGTNRKRSRKSGPYFSRSGVIVNKQGTGASAPGPGTSRLAQSTSTFSVQPATQQPGAPIEGSTHAAIHGTQQSSSTTTVAVAPQAIPKDRGVIAAAGGPSVLTNAFTARLPAETARHFDRDPETNEVLWFSGPPVDIPRPVAPRHSLEYLHFLAMKRKYQRQLGEGQEDRGDDAKRARAAATAPPPASQLLAELWAKTCGDTAVM